MIFCICVLVGETNAQVSYFHKQQIKKIFIDSLSQVVFSDIADGFFILKNNQIVSASLEPNGFRYLINDNDRYFINNNKYGEFINYEFQPLRDVDYSFLDLNTDLQVSYLNQQFQASGAVNCSIPSNDIPISWMIEGENVFVLFKDRLVDLCSKKSNILEFFATGFAKIDNNFIVGSEDSGIFLAQSDQIKRYYIPGISFPRKIKSLEYKANNLWILDGDKNLYVFDLNRQIIKRISSEVNDYAIDDWNKLWIAKGKKLESYTGMVNDKSPILSLENVLINDKISNNTEVVSGKEGDVFYFNFSYFYPPDKSSVELEYKLNEEPWLPFNQPLKLKNLKKGKSNLRVRANVKDRLFSYSKVFKINIELPFLQSIWFPVCLILGFLMTLLLWALTRNNALKVKHEKQVSALRMKYELLKEKQKLEQAKMNPHFLFNTLNSINGLIALNKNKEARKSLSYFSNMMRAVLNFSNLETIPLFDDLKFLERYMQLEKLITDYKFEYEIERVKDNVNIPPMIIQPFIENAIHHGFARKQGKGHIGISFLREEDYLKITIDDNGIGRNKSAEFKNQTHKSKATLIVDTRLRMIDKVKRSSYVEYEDKVENDESIGTTCHIFIPIR